MMLRQALASEPSAFSRVAPARPRTVSRANPPFSRNLPPHARANARFYWENRRQYGGGASSGSVVGIYPGALGTAPLQVVEYARQLFEEGDRHKHISPRAFDQVFAVFDRDSHASYHDALTRAEQLGGTLRNDNRQKVPFRAVASVPNFELGYCFTTKTSKHRSIATMPLHDCVRAFPDTKRALTVPLQQQAPVCRSPWTEPQRLRKDSQHVTSRNPSPQSDYWTICLSI